MAKGVELGIQPSEYEQLTPAGTRELFSRLSKSAKEEAEAEGKHREAEFKAISQNLGNIMKGINNTNDLLAKLLKKPGIL